MYPQAYIDYLIYFHTDRDYFECHEVLEEYWKTEDASKIWVGLIQIAVGLYHFRRKNYIGAKKMIASALNIIQNESLQNLGLNKHKLLTELMDVLEKINDKKQYEDMNLPISDKNLLEQCINICNKNNLIWKSPSNMGLTEIVHKHKMRDRTDIINEREKQKLLRQKLKKRLRQ